MTTPSLLEVRKQLELIFSSKVLARSPRSQQLLRYLVLGAMENATRVDLKESVIGMEVFGRKAGYDPRVDPIVRVSVGDLRKRIARYYETEGRTSTVRISIPLGSYLPNIHYDALSQSRILNDKAAMCVVNARTSLDQRTLQSLEAALTYLDKALKEHPEHPRLLALKAIVHVVRAGFGGLPSVDIEAAETLIDRAKATGEDVWELCVAEAEVRMALYFDWPRAEILFNRALELSHGESRHSFLYAAYLASQLRLGEYLEIKLEAVNHLAHDSVQARCELCLAQMFCRKLDDAEHVIRETIALFPLDLYMPYLHLAILHEAREEFNLAAEAMDQMAIGMQQSTIAIGIRGMMQGLKGDREAAQGIYDQLLQFKQAGDIFIPASQMACAAIGLKEFDRAADWFRQAAIVERDPIMNWLAILPFTRHLSQNANFRSLVIDEMHLKFPSLSA